MLPGETHDPSGTGPAGEPRPDVPPLGPDPGPPPIVEDRPPDPWTASQPVQPPVQPAVQPPTGMPDAAPPHAPLPGAAADQPPPAEPPSWAPAQPPGPPPARRPPLWRRPRLLVAVLVLLALVAGLLVWAPWVAPATPTQVVGASPSAVSVTLHWASSAGHTGASHYLILRDGSQVGSVPASETTFTDGGLRPGHSYGYRVVAGSWLRRSVPTAEVKVRTIAPSPSHLAVERTTANTVRLRWSAPANSPAPDKYEILRNGNRVRTIGAAATSYEDSALSPATSYRYQVAALWDGNYSDPSGVLRAKTVTPPLSAARLAGSSVPIKVAIVGNNTITNLHVGQRWTEYWDFAPRCSSGACAVKVSGTFAPPHFRFKTFTIALTRHGATYSGGTRAKITLCRSVAVTDTLTLRITIKKAAPDGTEWLAQSWTGTLSVAPPYTEAGGGYFCPGGTLNTTLSAG